ncbi:MAG: hypothetical protein AAGG51_13020 [Cyanobacteria bacterium P01_G01_bin.54]
MQTMLRRNGSKLIHYNEISLVIVLSALASAAIFILGLISLIKIIIDSIKVIDNHKFYLTNPLELIIALVFLIFFTCFWGLAFLALIDNLISSTEFFVDNIFIHINHHHSILQKINLIQNYRFYRSEISEIRVEERRRRTRKYRSVSHETLVTYYVVINISDGTEYKVFDCKSEEEANIVENLLSSFEYGS